MVSMLKKIKGASLSFYKKRLRQNATNFVSKYIADNDLEKLIAKANKDSNSTGIDDFDYVLLHQLIRTKKPEYVLECGTGRSTWIFAHALKQNHQQYGIKGKVVSMESIKEWYDEAKRVFPEEFLPYAEIRYSEVATFMYSFIKGTCYAEVPEYPYDVVFVDGPSPEIIEGEVHDTVNMDFIKVMLASKKSVTAVVDYRLRTNMAYGLIFGRDKVKFIKPWNVGILEDVTKDDMILNGDAGQQKKILSFVTQFKNAHPSWIKI